MNKIENHIKNFCNVRDKLNMPQTRTAYNLCWKKPLRFYGEHTPVEAIRLLVTEAELQNGRKNSEKKEGGIS